MASNLCNSFSLVLITISALILSTAPLATANTDSLTTEIIQGIYGCPPWGPNSHFYDPTASWIWNSPMATRNAPVGVVVPFGATYNNKAAHSVNGTIHVMVDNTCDVFVNNVLAFSVADLSYIGGYPQVRVLLAPGMNNIVFKAENQIAVNDPNSQNPAGIIYAVIGDGGDVLFHSGGEVAPSPNPPSPSPPSPTPPSPSPSPPSPQPPSPSPSPSPSPPPPPSPSPPLPSPPGSFWQTCNCLPPSPVFLADPSMTAPAAAAATTAAVAKLAADESMCVETAAASATASTAAATAAWHANVLAVTDPSVSLAHRMACAQNFVATSHSTWAYQVAKSALSASIASAHDRLAPANGENTPAVTVDITAIVDASDLAITTTSVANSQFALDAVTNNTNSVLAILMRQGVKSASHAAWLSVHMASHAAACAIHNAATAAATASAKASAPGPAAAIMMTAAGADASALTAMHAADLTAFNAVAAADLSADNVLAAVIAAANTIGPLVKAAKSSQHPRASP